MADKARFFWFILYPESAPEDWWERCTCHHGDWCCSPLHCGDNESEGKSHYHVMYRHPNTVSRDYVWRVVVPVEIKGAIPSGHPLEACQSPSGCMRYLLHLDDRDKEQFVGKPEQLVRIAGQFPFDVTPERTPAEKRAMRRKIVEYIVKNHITEYAWLVCKLGDLGEYELQDYVCSQTIFFTHFLASFRHGSYDWFEGVTNLG